MKWHAAAGREPAEAVAAAAADGSICSIISSSVDPDPIVLFILDPSSAMRARVMFFRTHGARSDVRGLAGCTETVHTMVEASCALVRRLDSATAHVSAG